ncbi:hypothetical protein KY332_01320 [Candidatus Woesearchaeota archaeon]|nr:hypothetical protein [Candidatus Woesearchaeota archaeon]
MAYLAIPKLEDNSKSTEYDPSVQNDDGIGFGSIEEGEYDPLQLGHGFYKQEVDRPAAVGPLIPGVDDFEIVEEYNGEPDIDFFNLPRPKERSEEDGEYLDWLEGLNFELNPTMYDLSDAIYCMQGDNMPKRKPIDVGVGISFKVGIPKQELLVQKYANQYREMSLSEILEAERENAAKAEATKIVLKEKGLL